VDYLFEMGERLKPVLRYPVYRPLKFKAFDRGASGEILIVRNDD